MAKTWTYKTTGKTVVYRKDDLYLCDEIFEELMDKCSGRVSDRVLQNMLAVAENVEAVRFRAAELGQCPTFATVTFWSSDEGLRLHYEQASQSLSLYRKRLRHATGMVGVRVSEWGKKRGRFHEHFVADREIPMEVMDELKWGTVIGRTHITRLTAGGYVYKEMGKGVGRRGLGRRLWSTFGDFKGKCSAGDFMIDSPQAECRRLAWRTRETGEPHRLVWERAKDLYGLWSAGKLSLGVEYDQYRGVVGGGGDAWEGEGGDTDFNVEGLE